MYDKTKIQIGDIIKHNPSGEEWVVAFADYERNQLSPLGWPESCASLSDCELVEKVNEEKFLYWLEKIKDVDDFRSRHALRLYGPKEQPNE